MNLTKADNNKTQVKEMKEKLPVNNEMKLPEKEFDIPVPEKKEEEIKAGKSGNVKESTPESEKDEGKNENNNGDNKRSKKNEKKEPKRNNEPEHKERDNSDPVIEDAEWAKDKLNEANNEPEE